MMATKLYKLTNKDNPNHGTYLFYCPGCQRPHPFDLDRWQFNGNEESPTFTPSLWCNKPFPETSCHLNVTNGKIQYHQECHHELRGQLVDMVDWRDELW